LERLVAAQKRVIEIFPPPREIPSKGDIMLIDELNSFFLRDIAALERELELYPDDSSVWQNVVGLPNSAGNLVLHLAGSLQHFFGAILGNTGYVRNRDAEFSKRDIPRNELRTELAAARQGVIAGFEQLTDQRLEQSFPARITDAELSTRLTILQFITHLAYHLGQLDYHRRMVTGNPASADTIAAPKAV
jgi:uncharacterized damage-inducible protein DinB